MFDYLIAGAGFAGAVVADRLARVFSRRVMVVDRRPHVGGNAYDHYDEAGILVHKYGPHIFHTNSSEVFHYLSEFTEWRPYEHRVLASVHGKLVPVPINLDTVNILYNLHLEAKDMETYLASVAEPRESIRTSEDVVLSQVGRDLYEKIFRGYTLKQWGLDPAELDASVIARIPVRLSRDARYFADTYQAMPLNGYTRMFENMLDHKNIMVVLGADLREVRASVAHKELIYTGPVDEYFDCRFGKLPYRSLEFRHEIRSVPRLQPVAVVNHPNEHAYTRVTEFKHLTGQSHEKTSIVYEYPKADGDPYYPIPRPQNALLYARYQKLAESTPNVHFTGRLATYKYYNMDQVVAQSLALCAKLTGVKRREMSTAGDTSPKLLHERRCPASDAQPTSLHSRQASAIG